MSLLTKSSGQDDWSSLGKEGKIKGKEGERAGRSGGREGEGRGL